MALALNNLKRVDMPLNKKKKTNKTLLAVLLLGNSDVEIEISRVELRLLELCMFR